MRLFVAVWPAPEVVELVAGLARPVQPALRWTTPDQWHVTLRFLGEVDDVEGVKGALAQLPTTWSAPTVAVAGPSVRCLGSSVLCLPVAGLDHLAAAVNGLTVGPVDSGVPEGRPFLGHLTLARGRRGVDLRALAGARLSATWPVADVTLVASRLHPEGARYEVLARYPVRRVGMAPCACWTELRTRPLGDVSTISANVVAPASSDRGECGLVVDATGVDDLDPVDRSATGGESDVE